MPRKPAPFFDIPAKVVGVTQNNSDGKSRQVIIATAVKTGDSVRLFLDNRNKFDAKAVAVLTTTGEVFGYLDGRLASDVRDWLLHTTVDVTVKEVTGGQPDKPNRGVNLNLRVAQ